MRARGLLALAIVSFALLGTSACAADANSESARESAEPGGRAPGDPADARAPRACGHVGTCPSDALCVQTRGALCMPLPPEGQSCPADCEPTPHCCNCPAFACLKPPKDACERAVTCGCIDDTPALTHCPPERRECTETPAGVDVLCINVDFDEDPFATDAGTARDAASR